MIVLAIFRAHSRCSSAFLYLVCASRTKNKTNRCSTIYIYMGVHYINKLKINIYGCTYARLIGWYQNLWPCTKIVYLAISHFYMPIKQPLWKLWLGVNSKLKGSCSKVGCGSGWILRAIFSPNLEVPYWYLLRVK
jgi:hypothetical protein